MSLKISVIIPAHNIDVYIGELLDCIKRQTVAPFETIVIDDGSTDNTAEIAKSYENVTVISTENMGVASARNTGVEKAGGEYIAFLDGDDLIADNYLEKLLAADGDVVKCSFKDFGDADAVHYISDSIVEYRPGCSHCFEYTVWASLIKKSLIDRYEIRFADGENYAEDAPYCMLLNSVAANFKTVDDILYFHRIRSNSAVAGVRSGKIKPYPPFAGMSKAIQIFRRAESDPIENEFYDFCVLRNLASFLTTQYMFRPYDGEFRRKLCDGCKELIDKYCPNAAENSYVFGNRAKAISSHPLVIRMAVMLMVKAYSKDRLFEFSSATSRLLRILNRTKA